MVGGRPVERSTRVPGALAVARYLDRKGLAELVIHIEGRDPRNPALLEPHPALLERAVEAAEGSVHSTLLVGDSVTDLAAARAAGVRSVGYANRPGEGSGPRRCGSLRGGSQHDRPGHGDSPDAGDLTIREAWVLYKAERLLGEGGPPLRWRY